MKNVNTAKKTIIFFHGKFSSPTYLQCMWMQSIKGNSTKTQ